MVAAHFVMDGECMTTDGAHDISRKRHIELRLKTSSHSFDANWCIKLRQFKQGFETTGMRNTTEKQKKQL